MKIKQKMRKIGNMDCDFKYSGRGRTGKKRHLSKSEMG